MNGGGGDSISRQIAWGSTSSGEITQARRGDGQGRLPHIERNKQLEVAKMKRCKLCGRLKTQAEADDLYCGKCEKVQGEIIMDLEAELSS